MPAGATTEGSIVAYLRMNDSDWNETLDRAEARAAALSKTDPTIKVDAKVSEAIAKIEAVEAAEQQLGDTTVKEEARMDAARAGGLSYWGKIGLAVAALLPMLAPIAGVAAAGTGALLGMGAAGVLAVLGIKQAMDDGTVTGRMYSQGLASLQANLKSLEATATGGVLAGFLGIVDEIDRQLPSLNQEVAVFSSGLGRVASLGVQSLVRGFQVLLPLFSQAQGWVEQLGVGFNRWVTGGGLAKWAADTAQVFPSLVQQLGAFVKMIGDVLGALSPLGVTMLTTIGLVSHLVDLLATTLGPALGPVAVGALAAWMAFKNWETIGPILLGVAKAVGLVSAEVTAATGPVGWVVAAVGLLVAVLVQATNASTNAASATDDYTSAIEQDTGALGDNTRAQLANKLAKSGAIEDAKRLHISATDVMAAVLGEGNAYQDLTGKLQKVVDEHPLLERAGTRVIQTHDAQGQAAANLNKVLKEQHDAVAGSVVAFNDAAAAQGKTTITSVAQAAVDRDLAAGLGVTVDQLHAAQTAQAGAAAKTAETTLKLQAQNDAATLLRNAFTLLNTGTLDLASAQTGVAAATNSLLDSFKQNGTVIDGNTKAAVANQQSLQAAVRTAQDMAVAQANASHGTISSTQAYANQKQALENTLKAQGALTPAVQAYIDKIYQIPKSVPTALEVQDAVAKAKLQEFIALQDRIRAVTIATIGVNVGTARTQGAVLKAGGGSIPNYLTYGGSPTVFQPHGTDTVPAMLTPGEFVLREKAASYDPQFVKAYNDNPAAALAGRGGGAQVVQNIQVTGVQQEDPRIIGRLVGQGAKQALAGIRLG